MIQGFWKNYTKEVRGKGNPFFALAPMADVTDPAFRLIVAKYSRHGMVGGGPDIFWTEFVSADGLASAGREVLARDLAYSETERPIVAQLFSSHPEKMREAARLCAELGFDGIDINMGCPDKSIEKQGAGACMIKTPEAAAMVIAAAKEGIALAGKEIPVSVKTRVGYNKVEITEWIPFLLSQDIAALTVHARTRKDLSKVPAKWEYIREVVRLRDRLGVVTVIIGNGDVIDIADGKKKAKETGCDGIMIGRAIFGNPWLFDSARTTARKPMRLPRFIYALIPQKWMKKILGTKRYTVTETTTKERLSVLIEHAELFETILGDIKNFAIMKKHFKAYVHGFSGAKELRMELMEEGNDAATVKTIIDRFFKNN